MVCLESGGGGGGGRTELAPQTPRSWSLRVRAPQRVPAQAPSAGGKMPSVVPDQRSKFEDEEFFRKLSRRCEINYTGFRDRPHEERQARFQNPCREGRSEIAFVATGTHLSLQFFSGQLAGRTATDT
ncbi:hypothetical protein P7K49_028760 [Saguinus oedipus]|uniref:Uncharacterized protein n=1 Tax=Saguinus oedipus TaxID=9490 RepID=A0ABQ9U591_SAGOE|nr:hypothetical protein P7K49_028760 [Saguinus oedipus]